MAIGRGSLTRLTLLALLWGSGFLWIAIALRGFSPVQIVLIRLTLGALVLVVIVYSRGLRLPASGLVWRHLTVAALFANAIPYTLFAIGEQHVTSSVAGVLNATTPLWTLVIAFATGHERRISAPEAAPALSSGGVRAPAGLAASCPGCMAPSYALGFAPGGRALTVVLDKIFPDNSSRDTAFTWQVTASGSLTGGTSAARDTWDGQPALAPDGRTIVDGLAFGRTAVGLWELPAAAR